ncbi:MAG: preprotein translocase subunit YajC [Spirochaetaceae bacterium]|jgi:preprotein translocase subunit YajC|nr:preprotein translocase subunit YajC [Spirochaetaceae bacterium]
MNLFNLPLLFGAPQGAGAQPASGMEQIISFAPFILIIAIFYFLIIRPQNKKQKETQKMLSDLKKGDKVVTIGGVHGTIASIKDSSIVVKVDDNVKIEFSRSAVASVTSVAKDEKPEARIEDKKSETDVTSTES